MEGAVNRLIERLGADYDQVLGRSEGILDRCHAEGREPSADEALELDGLRSDMDPLGERILELREVDDRKHAVARAMTPDGGDGHVGPLQSGSLASGHVEGRARPSPLICSDAMLRNIMQAVQTRSAYDQPIDGLLQTRATALVPTGAVAPDWLPPIAYGREPRIAEHVTNAGGSGTEADWLEVTTAAVATVVAEGAAKPDSGMVLTRKSSLYEKLACFTDASMELLADFNSTQALINAELLGAINTLQNGEIVGAISGQRQHPQRDRGRHQPPARHRPGSGGGPGRAVEGVAGHGAAESVGLALDHRPGGDDVGSASGRCGGGRRRHRHPAVGDGRVPDHSGQRRDGLCRPRLRGPVRHPGPGPRHCGPVDIAQEQPRHDCGGDALQGRSSAPAVMGDGHSPCGRHSGGAKNIGRRPVEGVVVQLQPHNTLDASPRRPCCEDGQHQGLARGLLGLRSAGQL
jgi:hypothetical protein